MPHHRNGSTATNQARTNGSLSDLWLLPAVSVDFEFYYDDEVSIKTLGVYGCLHHPKCEVYLVTITDGEEEFVGHPEDFDWNSIKDRLWVSHNRSADKLVYDTLREKRIIDAPPHDEWECSADLVAYLGYKRALKDAARAALGKEVSKDVRRLMKGLLPAQMRNLALITTPKGKLKLVPLNDCDPMAVRPFFEDVKDYALQDARLCRELWVEHGHKWPVEERRLSRLTTRQAHRGIMMDTESLLLDLQYLALGRKRAKAGLPWAKGKAEDDDKGVLSIPALRTAIGDLGLPAPMTTSEDSPQCKAWEAKHGHQCNYVQRMRDFRKLNILFRRVQTMLARLTPEGRMPFAWMYGGACTLRWTGGSRGERGGTGEKGFNPQNMQKGALWVHKKTGAVTPIPEGRKDNPPPSVWAVNLRHRCIATPGTRWACADAEQIEARLTWWMAGKIEELELVAGGMSIYEVHARETMGWVGGVLKIEDPRQYQIAKHRVLGLGFQCWIDRFIEHCDEMGLTISYAEGDEAVRGFRATEKKIVALWGYYDRAFRQMATRNMARTSGRDTVTPIEDFVVELPDGNEITIFHPHFLTRLETEEREKKAKDDAAKKGKEAKSYGRRQQAVGYAVRGDPRRKKYFGGLILENIVQRIDRQILAQMMLAIEDAGYEQLFNSHDEANFEVPLQTTEAELEKLLTVDLPWAPGLPFSVDVNIWDKYLKE